MFGQTIPNSTIDSIKINFSTDSLWILNIALAIIMFGVALEIKTDDFNSLFKKPKVLFIGILCQFILLPLATFLAVLILKPHPSFALGMIMVAACPGGNVSNFFSKMAKGNTALSISLTAFATLTSIIMTPFNLHFWGSLYEPTNHILKTVALNPFDLFKLVLLILGLPLLCGMLVHHYQPVIAKKLNKILRPFSIIFFLLLISVALYQNIAVFKNHIYLVFFLVVFHNIFAYIIGYTTAQIFN